MSQLSVRVCAAVAVTGLLLPLTASCSSPPSTSAPSPSSSDAATKRSQDASALIVQCALTRGLMKPPAKLYTPPGQKPWLQGKTVAIDAKNGAAFFSWFAGQETATVAGKGLEQWVQQAASQDKLPRAVCGSVSASALQKRVFAQDPAAGDPWRS